LLTSIRSLYRVKDMYFHVNDRSGLKSPLIADDIYEIIMKVCSRRDFLLIALISGSGD
jgi:hypothetical protein